MLLNFDYDGVIADSFDLLLDIAADVQRTMGVGRKPEADDFRLIEKLVWEDFARRIEIPEELINCYIDGAFARQNAIGPVNRYFPGMPEVLREAAESNLIVIVTSSPTEAVHAELKRYELNSAVSLVLGGELRKSKSERIAAAMARFGVPKENTIMVGDTIGDIREAKIAGVRSIAVSWGYQDVELLRREEPSFLVSSPGELSMLINGLD